VDFAEQARHRGRFHELGPVADYGQYAHGYDACDSMIATSVAKKLVGGTVGLLGTAGAAASHLAWYIRYRVEGTARDEPPGES